MDPFALLGAPRRFDIDLGALEKTHRELSRALHPDRFAAAGASERRANLEKAAQVNEAWRTLRDPIRRAEALFSLSGVAVGETNEPKPAPDFLMDVLEQREALSEARAQKDLATIRALGDAIKARARAVEVALTEAFAQPSHGAAPLLPLLGELRFYRRFTDEVDAACEEIEEAS